MKVSMLSLKVSFFALVLPMMAFGVQTYPLVCRGGGGTLGVDTTSNAGLMYFAKSPGPAGAGLQPGQCSWVDRAIGPNEPPCLRQLGINMTAWMFPSQKQNDYITDRNGAGWMRSMLNASRYQTFQVYNPGNGCFVVTRLGP